MPQPDKRALLAEGHAAGDDDAALHARLVGAGISSAAAKYEVDRLARDPMAVMLRLQAARMAKQGWLLANHERLAREADGGFALDTLDAPDPDRFYRHHYEANRPAKLTGIIDHWPALTRWSLDHFAAVAGDAVVQAQVERERDPDSRTREGRSPPPRSLRRTDRLAPQGGGEQRRLSHRLQQRHQRRRAGAAVGAIWRRSILLEARGPRRLFLAGAERDAHPWHHDLTNNLPVQVVGRKRVRMAPPWAFDRGCRTAGTAFPTGANEPLPAGSGRFGMCRRSSKQ